MSKRQNVTEAMFNKVHNIKMSIGDHLTHKEIAKFTGFHQTTISRILNAESFEDYKYKLATHYHKYGIVNDTDTTYNEELSEDEGVETFTDLGTEIVAHLKRQADALEELVKVMK